MCGKQLVESELCCNFSWIQFTLAFNALRVEQSFTFCRAQTWNISKNLAKSFLPTSALGKLVKLTLSMPASLASCIDTGSSPRCTTSDPVQSVPGKAADNSPSCWAHGEPERSSWLSALDWPQLWPLRPFRGLTESADGRSLALPLSLSL